MSAPNPLISVEELAELLAHPVAPALLDIRWSLMDPAAGHIAYLAGHLPGAAFVSMEDDLAEHADHRGRHPLPTPTAAAAAFARAGVHTDRPVVVYDAKDSTAAARAWWMLRWLGHTDVRVLDGGFQAWERAGLPVATGTHSVEPGDFVGLPGAMPLVSVSEVLDAASSGLTLVDARAAERYRGETEPIDPVAGHIPGAVNAPTFGNVDADGHFLPAAVLADRFTSVGLSPGSGSDIAAYCGSGITACHTLLAMERAGITGAALFPESWSGWITDPSRPIATGTD